MGLTGVSVFSLVCVTEPCGQHEVWQRREGVGPLHPAEPASRLFALAPHPRALQSKHGEAVHRPLPL